MIWRWFGKSEKVHGTLASLGMAERGRVTGIDGDDRGAQRLYEMGLVEGAEVTMVRRAPLGDPLEIRVMGYSLSLRVAEAARVRIAQS